MKKIIGLPLLMLALIASVTFAKVYGAKKAIPAARAKSPAKYANVCGHWDGSIRVCSDGGSECVCCASPGNVNLNAFIQAVAAGTTGNFFSDPNMVQAFALEADEAAELQAASTICVQIYNKQTGIYYTAVGSSPNLNFDNADFILQDKRVLEN